MQNQNRKMTMKEKLKGNQKTEPKLSYDMEREIKDAFMFYDYKQSGRINRDHLKCILGNFGFQQSAASEMDEFLLRLNVQQIQNEFSLDQTLSILCKKWLVYGGQKQEAEEMFALFDIDNSQQISFIEIKNLFNKYLDIPINDNDIHDFIGDIDMNTDGKISKDELLAALNYDFNKQ